MQLIRLGLQISKAVKQAHRLRQILGIFAKYGFADVFHRINLGKYIPQKFLFVSRDVAEKSVSEKLRLAFEELGPTFIKLGQLFSTRPDLIPEDAIAEFTKLQDNVPPVEFEKIKPLIERELGRSIVDAFGSFDPIPIGAASIAQAHPATLRDGKQVIVKVQRPEIRKVIETDIELLGMIAHLMEKYIPESRVFSPTILVNEFFRTIMFELDFKIEANNISKMAENLRVIPEIVLPHVYISLSTERVLTLERLEGLRVNDPRVVELPEPDRKQLVLAGARAFFRSVMIDGLFHGDMHGGNLFVLPGNRLGVIDFGIVGRLSKKARSQLANMLSALTQEDFENLAYQYAELGAVSGSIDFDSLAREFSNTLSPYMGLTLKDVNSGRILIEATRIAAKYNIRVPGDWMLVFKAMFTVEGLGRRLDPDFDLMAAGAGMLKELIQHQYSFEKIMQEFVWAGKDVLALFQVLPRQLRWMFRKFNSNDFAVEIKIAELTTLGEQINKSSRRTSLSLLCAGVFVSSVIAIRAEGVATWFGYPIMSVILFILAVMLFLRILLMR